MTRNKVPSRSLDLDIVFCDECKKTIEVPADAELELPWRDVHLEGWVGVMHACSDGCENGIRIRHENGTPTDIEIPVAEEFIDDEEDTEP